MKRALEFFPYFETWDDTLVAECCRLGSVVEFGPDEIILGSSRGNSHMIYFILEGTCKMINHINAIVDINSSGKIIYKLYQTPEYKASESDGNSMAFTSILFNEKYDFRKDVLAENTHINNKNFSSKQNSLDNLTLDSFQDHKGSLNERYEEIICKKNSNSLEGESNLRENESVEIFDNKIKESEKLEEKDHVKEQGQLLRAKSSNEMNGNLKNNVEVDKPTFNSDNHIKVLRECKLKSQRIAGKKQKELITDKPSDVKSFFILVGLLNKGACFGLEKNLKGVFILSEGKVKCLMIPRRFLIQHNPANIWNRIQLFFQLYIPKNDEILKNFITELLWTENKRNQTSAIVSLKKRENYTLSCDVPFSIRLIESS